MRSIPACSFALIVTACAHAPAAPEPRADAPRVSAQEQRLYDIALRLATDPAAQAELAPHARVRYHGEQDVDELLASAVEALGWLAEAKPVLLPQDAPAQDSEQTHMRCAVEELRCDVEQPGGVTRLQFAYEGAAPERRLVLSRIESDEP